MLGLFVPELDSCRMNGYVKVPKFSTVSLRFKVLDMAFVRFIPALPMNAIELRWLSHITFSL